MHPPSNLQQSAPTLDISKAEERMFVQAFEDLWLDALRCWRELGYRYDPPYSEPWIETRRRNSP